MAVWLLSRPGFPHVWGPWANRKLEVLLVALWVTRTTWSRREADPRGRARAGTRGTLLIRPEQFSFKRPNTHAAELSATILNAIPKARHIQIRLKIEQTILTLNTPYAPDFSDGTQTRIYLNSEALFFPEQPAP